MRSCPYFGSRVKIICHIFQHIYCLLSIFYDLCFQSMYKNELAIVSIKPNLAYGSQGRKPDIPPDSRITYLFGLLHFEKQKEISDMTWAQVILFNKKFTICWSQWLYFHFFSLAIENNMKTIKRENVMTLYNCTDWYFEDKKIHTGL